MTTVRRVATVIALRPSAVEEYERLHREVWPEVLAAITAAGISNYSIFRYGNLLFSYWEYEGSDYAADLAAIDEDPASIRWGLLMSRLQLSVEGAPLGRWLEIPEVFHLD